jgi:hypothetical protein
MLGKAQQDGTSGKSVSNGTCALATVAAMTFPSWSFASILKYNVMGVVGDLLWLNKTSPIFQ